MAKGFVQDVVTHIVNVHWAGAVFIAGEYNNSNIHYLKVGAEEWENLGTLDFQKDEDGYTGVVQGSAFAMIEKGSGKEKEPVFVLVGGGGHTDAIGIIMTSADGKKWSRVYQFGTMSDSYRGANIFAVVWDEENQSFYAGAHQSDNFADPDTEYRWMAETDILLQSFDGSDWKEIKRHQMKVESHRGEPFPPWPKYTAGLLAEHCSDRVKDTNGNGIPDGFYGYKVDELIVAPTDVASIDYFSGTVVIPDASSSVKVIPIDIDAASIDTDTRFPTNCVAFYNGSWMAAGGTYTTVGGEPGGTCKAAILRGDKDWIPLDPSGETMICTMIGGKRVKADD